MRKSFTQIFILFCFIFSLSFTYTNQIYASEWPQAPSIEAKTAIVIDADTGAILYSKDPHKVMYPASTTKILTALLACELSSLDESITMSESSINSLPWDASILGVKVGETLTMKDALYGLMLRSGNEIANAIAEHISGSVSNFSVLMNERAKTAGALNTNFNNPHGLYEDIHTTTAYDLAIITKDAIKNATFSEIWGTVSYDMAATNMANAYTIWNRHSMLVSSRAEYYKYALGGKTGYEELAGRVLVTHAKKNDLNLICVVMNTEFPYPDSELLMEYVFNNFKRVNIANEETRFTFTNTNFFYQLDNILGKKTSSIKADSTASIVIPSKVKLSDIDYSIEFVDDTKDNAIAYLSYKNNNDFLGGTKLFVTYESNTSNTDDTKDDVFTEDSSNYLNIDLNTLLMILTLLTFLFFMFLLIRVRRLRKKQKRKRRSYR